MFVPLLAIIPILGVYFLTKNFDDKRKFIINLSSIAVFLPLSNFIYYLASYFSNPINISALITGFCWVFLILPAIFLIYLIVWVLKYRKFVLLTIVATEISALIMIIIAGIITGTFEEHQTLKGLNDYQPAVEYIEEYKSNKGKYPNNIKNLNIKSEKFPYYTYETSNKNSDFILSVSPHEPEWFFIKNYKYCSTTELKGCDPDKDDYPIARSRKGNWVYNYNID
jgi:hypothetical protein